MAKPKVATVWCEGCSGCHMSFLDLDEALVDVLAQIELTVTPITDFKDFAFPDVDLGIIEGGVGNVEQRDIVRHLRQKARIIMAWGDCAVFGGINTLRNHTSVQELLRYGYIRTVSTVDGVLPIHPELPGLLDQVLPVNSVIQVDAYIPGCPPSPEAIAYGLTQILQGRLPVLS
jgi:NAD-reducing hydrogenase small subunit